MTSFLACRAAGASLGACACFIHPEFHLGRPARPRWVSAAVWAVCAGASAAALAADAVDTATPSLGTITVTGNPLGSGEVIAPTHQLQLSSAPSQVKTTLGETLDGLPGVSSSYFGPNASRPVIRGLDGDRIRILNNSGASLDASGLSYDHAVPLEPLTIERVEVLRGPGALLYGGSATGGVVNVLDNRIPREPIEGVVGKADVGVASGNRERGGALLVEGGTAHWGLHADAFRRNTGDVDVPRLLPCTQGGLTTSARRICNSASQTDGGAVGGSLFFDQGYLGASVSTYHSHYGTVAEDEVTIGMYSQRYALAGEWRGGAGDWVRRVEGQWSRTDYQHTEFEGSEAGTRFANQGHELRLQVQHRDMGPVAGVIGLQAESADFSADGEEAFAPFSHSRNTALFLHEEWATGWGKLSLGARTESVQVRSLGNPDTSITRFAVGERQFHPHSVALGSLVRLSPAWQLTGNLAHTQRAPKDYELFANGPHLATAAWETGNPDLRTEQSTSLDMGAAWQDGPHRFSLNAYQSRFARYIGLLDTGDQMGTDGERNPLDANGDGVADASGAEIVPEQAYRSVRARFTGLEVSGNLRLLGAGGLQAGTGQVLDLQLRGDMVRATNLSTGEPLPRIAPVRVGATLAWTQGPWSARIGADHSAAQNRVPSTSRATEAYTLWNLGASYRQKLPSTSLTWYARLDNATNVLAYSASSVLTSTAFPKAPLPGRSLKLGVQAVF